MKQFLTALGFLLIGIIAIVGLFAVTKSVSPAFNGAAASLSSAFKPAPKFNIDVESENINSDRLFVITTSGKDGDYKISYPCADGISVKQGMGNYIPCGEPTTIAVSGDKIDDLIITSTKEKFATVPITVLFTDSKSHKTAKKTVALTVVNKDANTNTEKVAIADDKEEEVQKEEETTNQEEEKEIVIPAEKPVTVTKPKPAPKYVKKVVKSKSMITEEIELNRELQRKNIEVVETDLGEFIVQQAGQKPYHIVTPAMHLSKEDIAGLYHKKFNTPEDFSPVELTNYTR